MARTASTVPPQTTVVAAPTRFAIFQATMRCYPLQIGVSVPQILHHQLEKIMTACLSTIARLITVAAITTTHAYTQDQLRVFASATVGISHRQPATTTAAQSIIAAQITAAAIKYAVSQDPHPAHALATRTTL